MSIQLTLFGGPPWGLRVSHNEELRPVVAKILSGGRAEVSGVRIGDIIEEVNNMRVDSTNQAHNLIQEAKGELNLKLARSPTGFHSTVAREKLSTSCQNSPHVERRPLPTPLSVPSSPIQQRANLFKQIRLDVQGIKGSADNKRRMFEQLCNPHSTDTLLQRKIQLGYFTSVPSESTTGYGSVGGDFAGGSGRTSPMSSRMSVDEEDDKKMHEDGSIVQRSNLLPPISENPMMFSDEMGIASAGPSQWTLKAESHGTAPAEGAIEVPRPRSVAALRQAITDKLEMKSPTGQKIDSRRTPSWSNVKVYEGVDDDAPSKPTFGRVLDGPVTPNKYYQGVPPPSYYINTSTKPPTLPPTIPPKPKSDLDYSLSTRNNFLNTVAAREEEVASPVPSESSSINPSTYYKNYYGAQEPMVSSLMTTSISSATTEQPAETAPEDPSSTVEEPSDSLRRGSMDLESSQLLKSKSPSPYTSSTADHYATIRRIPTPVRLEVDETPIPTRKTFSYSSTTNDSGYGETLSPRDGLNFDAFSTNSTLPASSIDQTIDTLSIESSHRPESLLSFSTVDGEANQGDKDDILPLRPVSNEPEMSTWYKNMFKKMHKLDPAADSVLRSQQLREASPSTISRPLTPNSCVSRPPSRFECEITPRRARSVGRVIEPEKEDSPSPSQIAEEIAELKRVSKEELMLRQKAERLQEELEEQRLRRHGYLPSATPALQKNFDRFDALLNDYGKDSSPAASSNPAPVIRTATVVYKFVPKSPRELPLNKGDIVRVTRQIDSNWLEGERNGHCGIFPATYVQLNNESDSRQKMRAVYPFTARNLNEMSLKIGEIIVWRRDIDQNWSEGSNHIGEIGIFPKCYVASMDEEMNTPGSVVPARPKTPKITFEPEQEDERTVTFDPIPQIEPSKPVESESYLREVPNTYSQEERARRHPAFSEDSVPIMRTEPEPITMRKHQTFIEDTESRAGGRAGRHPAFSEDTPVGYTNGYKENQISYRERKEREYTQEKSRDPRPNIIPQSTSADSAPRNASSSAWNGVNLANIIPKGSEVYRATFAYQPQKEDELELLVDDIVFVVEKCDDGWFIGTSLRDGQFGTFPGNYVVRH